MRSILLLFLGLVSSSSFAQNEIFPRVFNAVQLDGHFGSGEWDLQDYVAIDITPNVYSKVYYQYDDQNLYFAFTDHLGAQFRFPEVLLDLNLDRDTAFAPDDWWFHVSATDCENQGAYGVYDSCQEVRPNWIGIPNANAAFYPDTFEIAIPWSTLNYYPQSGDSIGIAFVNTNTTFEWFHWPLMADHFRPDTWGTMIFTSSLSTGETEAQTWQIYPLPATDQVQVENWQPEMGDLELRDMKGSLLKVFHYQNGNRLEFDLKAGMYLLRFPKSAESRYLIID
ncbi:hypothetical protein [Croceimicrobium sp.]|uniref:hypothetical protein n=1 Tax=Croceimicrobium sp. TaxID=2828340 RepID=UPI003BAD0FD6